ncbi:MAG TPA: DUF5108 domain-containing protein [Bacteroidales bacterium]|nr:DUF5108 domain-containing protein [Bacteroidales bacterium]
MKLKQIFLFMLPLLAFIACEDPYKDSTYQVYDENPISSYLSDQSEYSEWVSILKYANMFNALNQADQDFTAFVPNNEAVTAFYQKKGVASIEELGAEYAKSLVLFHTVLDTISVDDFINSTSITNLSKDQLSIQIDSTTAGEAILNGEARVTQMAFSVSNGVIYFLADVMTPLVETVYERVAQNESYSIMREALDATGWADSLNTLADTTYLDGVQSVSKRYYTFLAVTNASFAQEGIQNLSDLKTTLGAGENVQDSANALFQYVAYHILQSNYSLENLTSFNGADTSSIWDTAADNQVMMVTLDSLSQEKFFLNQLGTPANFVVESSDVLAKNGFLHEISGYLPIWEPQQATVLWDLTDYGDVRNLVPTEIYQPAAPVSSEDNLNIFDAASYVAEVSASGVSNRTYNYLAYVTCKTNLRDANYFDRLVINLGYLGHVTMRTPTLVKGKYRVDLKFVYLSDHAFMRTMSDGNGGLMKISFDGDHVANVSPYTTVTRTLAGVYDATLYDEIEFETTAKHDFKIIIMDPAASTNSKFSLQLDCITFTPITE